MKCQMISRREEKRHYLSTEVDHRETGSQENATYSPEEIGNNEK